MTLLDKLTRSALQPSSGKEHLLAPFDESSVSNHLVFEESTIPVPDPVYGLSVFSKSNSRPPKVAVGSFRRGMNDNYVMVDGVKYEQRHPASKVVWLDDKIFGTTSTSLRIWKLNEIKPTVKLVNSKSSPMTSFEFSFAPHKAATAHVNATISLWDIEKGKMEVQMIAHDKAVLDLKYKDTNQILSVSEDGSLRLFDLRDLDHSTIVYENAGAPLIRLAHEPDSSCVTVLPANGNEIIKVDIRKVGQGNAASHPPLLNKYMSPNKETCVNAISVMHGRTIAGSSDGTCTVFVDNDNASILPQPAQYVKGGIVNVTANQNTIFAAHDNCISLIKYSLH